jgi:hypothetical protein
VVPVHCVDHVHESGGLGCSALTLMGCLGGHYGISVARHIQILPPTLLHETGGTFLGINSPVSIGIAMLELLHEQKLEGFPLLHVYSS